MPTSVTLPQVTAAHPQPPRARRSLSGVTGLRVLLGEEQGLRPVWNLLSQIASLSSEKKLQSSDLNLWFYNLTVWSRSMKHDAKYKPKINLFAKPR